MRRYWWIILLFFLIACLTVKFERKLSPDIKKWYDEHTVLLDSYPPKELGVSNRSERRIFLTLSPEKQRKYIEMFWDVREEGLRDEYKLRLAVAERWFKGEGIPGRFTDRGRAMLLFGQPDYVEFRDQDGQIYTEGEEQWGYAKQSGYRWFQIWIYWHGHGFFQRLIKHYFEYDSQGQWRDMPNNDYEYRQFVEYWRWRMGPTEDGWKLIKDFMGE